MDSFFLKVAIAALSTVGIGEWIKNFFKPKNTIWYAVIMLPLAVCSYLTVSLLPQNVTGSLLTVGAVQLGYQSLVQGFKQLIENVTLKMKNSISSSGGN